MRGRNIGHFSVSSSIGSFWRRIIKRPFDILLNSSDGDTLGMEEIESAVCNSGSIWLRIVGHSDRQLSIASPLLIRSIQLSRTCGSLTFRSLFLTVRLLPDWKIVSGCRPHTKRHWGCVNRQICCNVLYVLYVSRATNLPFPLGTCQSEAPDQGKFQLLTPPE